MRSVNASTARWQNVLRRNSSGNKTIRIDYLFVIADLHHRPPACGSYVWWLNAGIASYRHPAAVSRLCLLFVIVLLENLYVLTPPCEHLFRFPFSELPYPPNLTVRGIFYNCALIDCAFHTVSCCESNGMATLSGCSPDGM